MDWQGKRVLVTGGGGFSGSHLVERLVGEAEARPLGRYNSRNHWGLLELLPKKILNNLDVVMGDLTHPFGTARALKECTSAFQLAASLPYRTSMRLRPIECRVIAAAI